MTRRFIRKVLSRDIVDNESSREKRNSCAVSRGRRFAFRTEKKRGRNGEKRRQGEEEEKKGDSRLSLSWDIKLRIEETKRGGGGERDRAGEYRHDMHYTMDARFSCLISLNSTVPPPVPRGIARYRSRKSNLRKYTYARDVVQRTRHYV